MTPLLAALIVLMVAFALAAGLIALGARYDRRFERPREQKPFDLEGWPYE